MLKREHLLRKKEVRIEVICACFDLIVLNSTCMKYVRNWQPFPQHPTLDQPVWLLVLVSAAERDVNSVSSVYVN